MAAFTKTAIKISFLKLLSQKPLSKITVKEIVEDCQINRNSFYYHFSDIPALIEEILMDEVNQILSSKTHPKSIYQCLIEAIDFALENKNAVMHIYNSANRELLEQYLNKVSQHAVERYISFVIDDCKIVQSDKEAIIMYYKCQLVGFVLDWLSCTMKYDLRDKINRICQLYDGAMEKAFERCKAEE